MKKLVITDLTRSDLDGIAKYTEREWGAVQKRRYIDAIKQSLARLRARPGLGAPRDDVRPGYRSVGCGRHVIFYRETADSIEIVRVLHGRMDLHRHLGDQPG